MSQKQDSEIKPGAKVHFIGIGGIGMSGLAQMLVAEGCIVSGSDRGIDQPENQRILNALRAQGIKLFPQDGSYITERPDALVYSTAIEDDNPDFVVAAGKITKIHRSQALEAAINLQKDKNIIAVTGSCGKTTVSSWLAESLFNSGIDASLLSGGLVNTFTNEKNAGNFKNGQDNYMVFEADESDKSLLNYSPDYSLVLNIGTDHYSKEELIEVFQQFLRQTKKGAVLSKEVYDMLGSDCVRHLKVILFSGELNTAHCDQNCWTLSDYTANQSQVSTTISIRDQKIILPLPAPGIHTAANALSIYATLDLLGINTTNIATAISDFKGVWRRFDYHGLINGAKIYDDYAHNVEKIISSISAAREITQGGVTILFQPHGYGPLSFMKDELFKELERSLESDDIFCLLPVFYAGGTSSFVPKSESVISDYQNTGTKQYKYFDTRQAAEAYLKENLTVDNTAIVMGARDNSLSDWANEITQ